MEQFQKLGETVEYLWREKNYDETLFPAIAANALREANLPEKLSAWEVIEWTLKQTHLPEQKDVGGKFGDPPITLYNSPRFHVDVYFWLEGTTAIHQHAFCGAFQVLMGSSIHSWFEFETSEKINFFTEIGNLNLKTCDLLSVGDVQEIQAGKPYIHGLFHLDQPSATIVVRTHKSPLHLPQFSYYKPYLAVDPFFEEPDTLKKLQSVSALIRAKHPETDRIISEWLETADFQTTFSILSNLRSILHSNKLDQMFNPNAPVERFEKFMEIARMRHGERANIFSKVFEHRENVDQIIKRRSYITDGEQRFFLALLMNVEGKVQTLSLIKERFPDTDPIEKVLDWTFDLAQTRVLGEEVPNALGIENFDDIDLFVLESLLKDRNAEEMESSLKSDYPNDDVTEIAETLPERAEKIKSAVIFKPLFQ
ncbi:hypothetical protein BH20ACI4_BH20ACI4_03190 [soil metagenome]